MTARDVIADWLGFHLVEAQGSDGNVSPYDFLDAILSSENEQARQKLAALLVPWRPIETAPSDQRILLWVVAERQSAAITGQISSHEAGKIWNGHSYQPNLATHWFPLPAPPKEDKA